MANRVGTPTATPSSQPTTTSTVWLCRPGLAPNPCAGDLGTTVISPTRVRTIARLAVAQDPPVDCFYVYPTVSRQKGMNATLAIDPEEKAVAIAQAALFSQVCNVYAPIYPQLTLAALNSGRIGLGNVETAYQGVSAAFDDYMAHYNHGRGIVFIGHSQGAMLLRGLLRMVVDPNPDLRKLVISALLMGANVTVAAGRTAGGDFANIPACTSATETGCVVAYSSFDRTPPANAVFGRMSGALSMFTFGNAASDQIMCVNPAAIGGTGTLMPYFPTVGVAKLAGAPRPLPTTSYVSYSNELTAQCKTSGDATWLQITRNRGGALPAVSGSEGPEWGLHDVDVSLALGNLVDLVPTEAAAFSPRP